MKNAMKFGLALVAFLTAFVMRANDTNFSVSVKSGKVISFTLNETKNVHVSITGKEGITLFDEVLRSKDGKITRTYDLAALPSGTYYLETETPAKVSRHLITIEGANATVEGKTVAEIYKPVLVKKDGFVSVNILNNEKLPVEIKMYDENNNELYSETITGEQTLSKTFDIRSSTAQNFTLVTSYNNKTFVDTIAAR